MYVPPIVIVVMVILYIYLISVDVHLHRRLKKLEKTVRKLEGTNGTGEARPRWEGKEDVT